MEGIFLWVNIRTFTVDYIIKAIDIYLHRDMGIELIGKKRDNLFSYRQMD